MEKENFEQLIYQVIGALIEVHKQLGPGFLENIYHSALKVELEKLKINFDSEKEIIMYYKGQEIGVHRLDLFIENELIVELKAVDFLHKKHYAQVRSYLKLMNKEVGLLVNFSDTVLDQRRVNVNFV
jgi:GxxExxY protein